MRGHSRSMVSAVLALLVGLAWCAVGAQQSMAVTGVRLDDSFRLVGSVSSGLVVSVRIDTLSAPTDASAFALRIFDEAGKPSGELTVLAMRSIDEASPKTRWILLDGQNGLLERSYAALIKSGAAIVHKGRAIAIEKAGRYEFVFLVGPKVQQVVLVHGESRPDIARLPVGSFRVPWP